MNEFARFNLSTKLLDHLLNGSMLLDDHNFLNSDIELDPSENFQHFIVIFTKIY